MCTLKIDFYNWKDDLLSIIIILNIMKLREQQYFASFENHKEKKRLGEKVCNWGLPAAWVGPMSCPALDGKTSTGAGDELLSTTSTTPKIQKLNSQVSFSVILWFFIQGKGYKSCDNVVTMSRKKD